MVVALLAAWPNRSPGKNVTSHLLSMYISDVIGVINLALLHLLISITPVPQSFSYMNSIYVCTMHFCRSVLGSVVEGGGTSMPGSFSDIMQSPMSSSKPAPADMTGECITL